MGASNGLGASNSSIGGSAFDSNTINILGNSIVVNGAISSGNNAFYGNMQSLNICDNAVLALVQTGNNSVNASASGNLDLSASSYLVGDLLIPGAPILNGSEIINNNLTFGSNSLTTNAANGILEGNMDQFSLSASGLGVLIHNGSNNAIINNQNVASLQVGDQAIMSSAIENNMVSFAANQLTAAPSAAAIVANISNSHPVVTSETIYGNVNDVDISAANNVILQHIGDTNVTLNASLLTTPAVGDNSSSTALVENNAFTFGSVNANGMIQGNSIIAGNGNDTVYGNTNNFELDANAANTTALQGNTTENVSAAYSSQAVATAEIVSNPITMDSNTITTGTGNDIIYGDINTLILDAQGQNSLQYQGNINASGTGILIESGAAGQVASNDISLNSNGIHAGDGNNVVYGNVNDIWLNAQANDSINYSGNSAAHILSVSGGIVFNDAIVLSGNNITTGGGSDLIYGNADNVTLDATAIFGTNLTSMVLSNTQILAQIDNNHLTFGGNTIDSGSSSTGTGSDTIFTDVNSIDFSATQQVQNGSHITTTQGSIFGNTILFNDSTVTTGNGNTTVVADVLSYGFLEHGVTYVPSGNHVSIQDGANNMMTFGNDTINFGPGHDNYVATLYQTTTNQMGMEGNVTINNFNNNIDVIQLGDVLGGTKAALALDVGTPTHTATSTTFTFNGGGSLTLNGVGDGTLTFNTLNLQTSANEIQVNGGQNSKAASSQMHAAAAHDVQVPTMDITHIQHH
jgi:hypothetical protein